MTDATRSRRGGGRESDGAEHASEVWSGGGLRMHTLHAELPIPYLTADDITANARATGAKLKAPTPSMPSPKRLAFYGGLGALAVLGAIDWPVAVAIGAATVVARSGRREAGERESAASSAAAASTTNGRGHGGAKGGTRGGAKETAKKASAAKA
ncbi:hypothetical protein [Streptomyces sp. AK02-01A]|uniref:hypothetical protein n=1 Tax=Streptomyces sp. AK02-01A TaxID=3028648 RepID=UPI0029B570EA|nr:hypothetical protein [Streptomyces sp. AK02-01A]MDX3854861.1 hypothetical protein [Streptomyces sp. AK02-01A]